MSADCRIYESMRPNYCGLPYDDELLFDVELVDKSVRSLERGKAAGRDTLTAEHLQLPSSTVYGLYAT